MILKKRLLISLGPGLFFSSTALAAQGFPQRPEFSSFFFMLSLVLAAAVSWLWSRQQRIKRENKDMRVRLQLAQQTLDQAPWDIVCIDPALKIVQANQSALQSAGDRQLIGSNLLEMAPEMANHPVLAVLQSREWEAAAKVHPETCTPADQENFREKTLTLIAADGKKRAVCYSMPPADIASQQEEQEMKAPGEQDRSTTNEISLAMDSASRMKSEFIANINHEIRTPMNAIIGYAEMLINADLGPKEKRFVDIIHKSSMTLVSIFNDIMELSRIDSGRLQILVSLVRLQSLVSEIEELFKEPAQEKGLRFHCRIARHLQRPFLLDGLRLKQVLQNLVSNAVKFTNQGSIELLVDGDTAEENGESYDLRFTVVDSGIGIPAADQQKIFELFQQREDTISKRYGGVGLGLTLCSRLVAMMGGEIELFSNEGQGARFTVSLNAIKTAEHTPEDLQLVTAQVLQDREEKLLVVDDVDLIKNVFIDYFQESPVKVLTANTGAEALAIAAREQPDIIFMDLNLAGTNGRVVTEQLHRQPETASIPVVVMTGEILEESEYKPLFVDFLQKPFRLEALKEIVTRYARSDQAEARQPATDENIGGEDRPFISCIASVWTEELEQLHRQAVRSGSLSAAVSLGAAMKQTGETMRQPLITELGEELMQYAGAPDILGVDRLLAKLSTVTSRTQP